ncbi:PH domain-containing protein [Nocardioides perillae]|uniref:Putative membrane protein n=1 Tax=Nocardioides perillae TaxID=1119534 RepID=A0A7Y9RY51_9ACTN|nr:PH domain-containing protein [Nocardioides perillae]NYG56723.1 putative membrane protein [Nocardioides perillae]
MTVVDPLRTLRGFAVPIVIAVVGIGSGDVGLSLRLAPVMLAGALLLGLVPWLTTRWQVTPTQLQVRRGLISRRVVTAPLDRVRSVDLEASLLHRVLGLVKVQVGTGVDDTRIELDALARHEAHALQAWLLAQRAAPAPADHADHAERVAEAAPPTPPVEELARIDWSWLRFAPFSLARLVVVAGTLGVLSQVLDDVDLVSRERVEGVRDFVLAQALAAVLVVGVVGALVAWVALSTIGYVLQWWDLRLVRTDGSLRMTAGLVTTRSTTVEEARVRGVRLSEPPLLRLVGGAELAVLATGVGSGGTTSVLPPSPRTVDVEVGHRVVDAGEADRPLDLPLTGHGPAARRRAHLRALRGVLPPVAAVVAAAVWWVVPPAAAATAVAALLLLALGVGELSWRHLGHALTPAHLVAGAPAASRTRTVLETDGVIGWNVTQGWFQRRAGLVTLTATTAAGPERVVVHDVPRQAALDLATRATPGLLEQFLVGNGVERPGGRSGATAQEP